MYGNFDAALSWLLEIYLIKECNITRIKSDSCLFCNKDDNGKLELVVYVHISNVFMAVWPDTLDKLKIQ